MQKHALALGYFFLAVFCIYVRQNSFIVHYYWLLQAVTVIALIVGGIFFFSASIEQLRAVKGYPRECKAFLAKWVRKAQQPPSSEHDSVPSSGSSGSL